MTMLFEKNLIPVIKLLSSFSTEDVSPGVQSIGSIGEDGIDSPKLSSTREMQNSANRSRRHAGSPSEPDYQVPVDLSPGPEPLIDDGLPARLSPNTLIIGQAANLLEARDEGNFESMDIAARNILFGVSNLFYFIERFKSGSDSIQLGFEIY